MTTTISFYITDNQSCSKYTFSRRREVGYFKNPTVEDVDSYIRTLIPEDATFRIVRLSGDFGGSELSDSILEQINRSPGRFKLTVHIYAKFTKVRKPFRKPIPEPIHEPICTSTSASTRIPISTSPIQKSIFEFIPKINGLQKEKLSSIWRYKTEKDLPLIFYLSFVYVRPIIDAQNIFCLTDETGNQISLEIFSNYDGDYHFASRQKMIPNHIYSLEIRTEFEGRPAIAHIVDKNMILTPFTYKFRTDSYDEISTSKPATIITIQPKGSPYGTRTTICVPYLDKIFTYQFPKFLVYSSATGTIEDISDKFFNKGELTMAYYQIRNYLLIHQCGSDYKRILVYDIESFQLLNFILLDHIECLGGVVTMTVDQIRGILYCWCGSHLLKFDLNLFDSPDGKNYLIDHTIVKPRALNKLYINGSISRNDSYFEEISTFSENICSNGGISTPNGNLVSSGVSTENNLHSEGSSLLISVNQSCVETRRSNDLKSSFESTIFQNGINLEYCEIEFDESFICIDSMNRMIVYNINHLWAINAYNVNGGLLGRLSLCRSSTSILEIIKEKEQMKELIYDERNSRIIITTNRSLIFIDKEGWLENSI